MSKLLVIFHSQGVGNHCDDGFAAAWAVRAHLGDDVEFYPGVYQQDPPDVTGRHVVLVDFSYKRPVIDKMITQAYSLLILDHHHTAAEDLAGLPPAGPSYHEWEQSTWPVAGCKVGVLFDMERSGAGIAWDFYSNRAHTGDRRPEFIDYIEDRDLWRKKLPEGNQFTIALRSFPQDFQVWDRLVAGGVQNLIARGHDIWRYYEQRIAEMRKTAYLADMRFEGGGSGPDPMPAQSFHCLIANAPYFAASELAGAMAAETGDHQFGASYFEVRPGEWQYSLRSRGDFDVSAVARLFGGGGHKAAAGFTVHEPVHIAVSPAPLPVDENQMASTPGGLR